MRLATRLFHAVPKAGVPIGHLRGGFKEIPPGQLDAAIQGLLSRGWFRLSLGIVTAPGKSYVAPAPSRRTMATRFKKIVSPEQLETRATRKRIADALWRARNREKIRAYHRAYVPIWRARKRAAALSSACI